jgi:hypothetical protein
VDERDCEPVGFDDNVFYIGRRYIDCFANAGHRVINKKIKIAN